MATPSADAAAPRWGAGQELLNDFGVRAGEAEACLEAGPDDGTDEAVAAFLDGLHGRLADLQERLAEAAAYITAYDQRVSQGRVDALRGAVEAKAEELRPRAAFSFARGGGKKKKKNKNKHKQKLKRKDKAKGKGKGERVASIGDEAAEAGGSVGPGILATDGQGEENAVPAGTLELRDLVGVERKVCSGVHSNFHASGLKECVVVLSPVSGSAHITGCTDTVFVLACHQVRIHECVRCSFYIHATSKPIIEECSELGFAPFALSCPDLDQRMAEAGLDADRNCWDDVQDFDWLRSTPSPNWHVVPEPDRLTFDHDPGVAEDPA